MAHEQPINLDAIAAGAGFEMAQKVSRKSSKKDAENWITKSLGVLQEQGIYAFFLYLRAQNKEATKAISAVTESLLRQEGINIVGSGDILDKIRGGLVKDMDKLLLGHSVLTQALIYARYHAKALPDSKPPQAEEDTR